MKIEGTVWKFGDHIDTDVIIPAVHPVTTDMAELGRHCMEGADPAFAEKHLPDSFYMEGDQRISIRTNVLRELIVNLLIHREYLNNFPAKFVIEKNRLFLENANKPHTCGIINIHDFTPFPKNRVPPSLNSKASCVPVLAPDGTAALDSPLSVYTSTSTVGFPLESNISLPIIQYSLSQFT